MQRICNQQRNQQQQQQQQQQHTNLQNCIQEWQQQWHHQHSISKAKNNNHNSNNSWDNNNNSSSSSSNATAASTKQKLLCWDTCFRDIVWRSQSGLHFVDIVLAKKSITLIIWKSLISYATRYPYYLYLSLSLSLSLSSLSLFLSLSHTLPPSHPTHVYFSQGTYFITHHHRHSIPSPLLPRTGFCQTLDRWVRMTWSCQMGVTRTKSVNGNFWQEMFFLKNICITSKFNW